MLRDSKGRFCKAVKVQRQIIDTRTRFNATTGKLAGRCIAIMPTVCRG